MDFPNLKDFLFFSSQANVIPVVREIIADLDTPVSAYLKISLSSPYSFLLESADRGKFGRYSYLGADPYFLISAYGRKITLKYRNGKKEEYWTDSHPLDELKKKMENYRTMPLAQLPDFSGGCVGYLGYEMVHFFEPSVPRASRDDLNVPDLCFLLADTLIIFDHQERKMFLVANAIIEDNPFEAYKEAKRKLDDLQRALSQPFYHPLFLNQHKSVDISPQVNMTKEEYIVMTEKMQEYIRAGDIFQVVPSQRWQVRCEKNPIDVYRALRLINPSPYMFCLKLGDFSLVGSSPEVHVRYDKGRVYVRPIAGTRPRDQSSPEEEEKIIEELKNDPKEKAEHIMLVDLARNDIGRVCSFNTVTVKELMVIEKYSHVIHLVSSVEGIVREGITPFDVLEATFPAGTVTGAPKVRAMQIIAQLEPTCRGPYAGVVGCLSFSGYLDSCIAIRTILIKEGIAYLQAGGGLVADSTPLGEYLESSNKAKAGLKALAMVESFL
ncbi:anthranilate synthase component I [Methylacidiphilum caldifontis]|uniref:Anthranilate synthase component 1 n=1 Tax=Methylacidiphilum caldifontis TaxID=2795386 RepID=A0A4Y8PGU7_9BACT|nr:anthranilate synthase component I [Methylacidiphilum caldifontis]QSR88437.1 anthranilate synthase component I [Methylacidiphilum caldifontis]TFE71266.1 anthranilate synthase component I [Methylacidiphilum caldifontis]